MTHVTFAAFLGLREFFWTLAPFVFLFVFPLAFVGAAVFLIVHFSRRKKNQSPPPQTILATQIISRKCPQCGAELKPDVSEGLCPACLLQRGIATEGGAPPGTPPFVPPTIPDLARLFPQLEILELIGKGGMGAVYKARQPALDRFVALKILSPRSGGDLDFAERFTREARALAKLSHPNIVAVYDFGQVQRSPGVPPGAPDAGEAPALHYFIMEFVDGPNLRQVEQAGKFSPREALEIIPQICAALQFAHDEGIVHRDIKPENVLLDKKGRVKIADFGLAKILGQEPQDFRLTGAKDVVGTPHYMAPEQVEKPQAVDHRADIYSLGVVFYEMLTGELPLGKFQPPSSCARGMQIDVRLDEVVLHALEKEPARRYQQVSEVKTRVETIAMTSRSSGHESAPSESQSRLSPAATAPPLRHGVRAGLGVFLGTVILVTGITFLLPEIYVGIARVELSVASPQNDDPYRLQTEFAVIESSVVLKPVADSLNLGERWRKMVTESGGTLPDDEVVELMKRRLALQPVRNTSIFEVQYYSQSPKEAAEIANKISEVYCALPPGHRGEIIDPAIAPLRPAKPNRPLNIFIGVVAGAVLGIFTGLAVGLLAFWRGHAAQRSLSPPTIQKPGHFWRWFAMTVLAFIILVSIGFLILQVLMIIAVQKQIDKPKPLAVQNTTNSLANASAETWSPTLAPGEKPDVDKIRHEAQELVEKGQYEEALQRHIWYHNHALQYGTGQTGVRLSFALADWVELGRRYPKAKQALIEIRDHDTQEFAEGRGYFDLFMDVHSLNQYLGEDEATYSLFKRIEQSDPPLAQQCFGVIEDLLVNHGEYDLCLGYIGDPQTAFESIHQSREQMKKWEDQLSARRQEPARRFEEMAKTNSLYTNTPAPFLPEPPRLADKNFVAQTRQLIEILVGSNRKIDAEKIHDEALAVLNVPELQSAVSDAELKIQNSNAVQTLAEQPPVVVETWPVSGARDVEAGVAEIRVRFSKGMADGSWSWSTAWENSTPEIIGQPHYEADGRTCVAKVKLEPGQTYAWWLNSDKFKNFTDLAGWPAVPYLLIFQTKPN